MTSFRVWDQHLIGQTTGRRHKSHETTPDRQLPDVSIPPLDLFPMSIIAVGPGIGMEAKSVMAVRAEEKGKRRPLPGVLGTSR